MDLKARRVVIKQRYRFATVAATYMEITCRKTNLWGIIYRIMPSSWYVIDPETGGEDITLMGVDDPSFLTDYLFDAAESDTVGRGVGNSMIPIRLNNRPEIIVAELKSMT